MKPNDSWCLWFLILSLALSVTSVLSLAVMSVDLGSEWMKVAIVSPGVPMEIALNKESQRKTPVAIAFRDGERMIGESAATIGVRFPEKTYLYFTELLGKTIDNPLVRRYQERFPHHTIVADPTRNTLIFKHPEGMNFTPEELTAMILKNAQEIAEAAAGQTIKDVVITVPVYFGQAERRALLLAGELAGLKVLQLLNDNAAVALNYGVFRRKEFNDTPTTIMFYDMGATSTVVTIASYQLVKTKERGYVETNPQCTIKGVGFDRTLGGVDMQLRLRDYLAKAFNSQKKVKSNVFENKRAMAKLFKEAGRVKKVLSANADHFAQVENLMEDQDFRTPVTREEYESMCKDLLDRVGAPIEMALQASSMTLDEIDLVILAGAGTRVPKVQQTLLEIVKKPELGKSLNTDEAAAMGAAYQAAHLSKGFKVKPFVMKDTNVYPIQIDFQRDIEQEDGSVTVKNVRRTLFSRNNPFPQKKVFTFNRNMKNDFDFFINYGELDFLPPEHDKYLGSLNLSKVSLKGVSDAIQKHTEEEEEPKGVKAHFRMDESGILRMEQVESVFEKKVEEAEVPAESDDTLSAWSKLGSTIGKLFTGGSDDSKDEAKKESTEESKPASESEEVQDKQSAEETKTEEPMPKEAEAKGEENATKDQEPSKDDKGEMPKEQKTEGQQKSESGNATISSSPTAEKAGSDTNDTKSEKKEPKILVVKEPITVEQHILDIPTITEDQSSEMKKKLKDLDAKDREKLALDIARNSLESFVLDTKDKLYQEEFEKASTDEERNKMISQLNEVREWLEYESDGAGKEVFKDKLSDLKSMSRSLFERVREHKERPEALNALKEMLNLSSVFLEGARNTSLEAEIFTDVELKTLETLIQETKDWKREAEKEQKQTPLTEFPKLTVKSISEKIAALDREVKYLINKARFATPKKKEEKESEKSDNTTERSEEESSTETPAEPTSGEAETLSKSEEQTSQAESVETPTVEEPLQLDDSSQSDTGEPSSSSQSIPKPTPSSPEKSEGSHSEL